MLFSVCVLCVCFLCENMCIAMIFLKISCCFQRIRILYPMDLLCSTINLNVKAVFRRTRFSTENKMHVLINKMYKQGLLVTIIF